MHPFPQKVNERLKNYFPFQETSVLRGEHRQTMTEIDGRHTAPKVGHPRESNVRLLEKQRTFEAMDHQARKVEIEKNF